MTVVGTHEEFEPAFDALLRDMLEWISRAPRAYDDVMDMWRTSCPRLPVWEEANRRGFVTRVREPGSATLIAISAAGRQHLSG